MSSTLLLAVLAFAPASSTAGSVAAPTPLADVVVRVRERAEIPPETLYQAQNHVIQIFEHAGIRLRFNRNAVAEAVPGGPIPIEAEIVQVSPRSSPALGVARPFAGQGVRVEIYYDRLERLLSRMRPHAGRILAHVLAHEIAHVLTRIPDHASNGLMKARWDHADFRRMAVEDLPFCDRDLSAMRETLSAWKLASGDPGR